jgi:hypothetical protein
MNRIRKVLARKERGATAVVVAFSMLFVFAAAALGMDIAKLAYSRQQVRAAIDAAAEAGAYALPNAANALNDAVSFASANYSEVSLTNSDVKFYCVVKKLATGGADTSQFGYMCDPGTAGVDYQTSSIKCNDNVCAVPCPSTKTCNMISVSYDMTVNFDFAPAIGISTGTTGAQTSASCRGACGEVAPNPMDVVVMADRTPSMKDGNGTPAGSFTNMKQGLKDMLLTMNRDQQFVAFGTIALSVPTTSCKTAPPSGGQAFSDAVYKTTGVSWNTGNKSYHFNGSWVPISYSWNYTTGSSAAGNLALNTSDPVWKGINCLDYSDDTVTYPNWTNGKSTNNNEGTHLASAMKAATQFILDDTKRTGFPDRSAYGTPKKVIIFETDGAPSEIFNSTSTALTLGNDLSIGASSSSGQGCSNLLTMAGLAKAQGITIITIGVGGVNTADCSDGRNVYDVLAASASPKNGKDSTGRNCTDSTARAAENSDGDNYFCAASATDLKSVFAAAMGSVTGNTKFLKISGVGN